jgi:hypothetical protein
MTMGDPDSGTVIHGQVTNLINVGTVNDGFAFPSGAPSLPPPQQLPPALDEFENQAAALNSLRTPRADGPILHLVVGPPGAGKSALTLHWANLDTDRFPDGRIYLDLRGHNPDEALSPGTALGFLLSSLVATPSAVPADLEHRVALWRTLTFNRKLLIVLDNAAASEQVKLLTATGPGTVTAVTSRDNLSELAEQRGAHVTRVDILAPDYSISLLRRLIAARHGTVDDRSLRELAELCGHLQLALRVAARRLAKSPVLTVDDFIDELRESGRILGPVRALFDSVYQNLPPATARLFRLLGVAPGSDLSLEAIIALAGVGRAEVRDQIEELHAGNLIAPGRAGRFVMHDLLHAYSAELAADTRHRGEADAALDRLARWYTKSAQAAAYAIGSEQPVDSSADAGRTQFASGAAAQQWYGMEEPNLGIMVKALTSHQLTSSAVTLSFRQPEAAVQSAGVAGFVGSRAG